MLSLLMLALARQNGAVLAPNAHLATPVAGLERTDAHSKIVPASGRVFRQALQVSIGKVSAETNETQLTLANATSVKEGDVMMASVWIRGSRPNRGQCAQAELLFEKATSPWTKSVTQGFSLREDWQEFDVPFRASESYVPGQAMLSLRLAFGPQTVEIGSVSLIDYGTSIGLDSLVETAADRMPLGNVALAFDPKHSRQKMLGLGGNFCQPRYGSTEPLDVVGRYALQHLKVAHARIGLPLEKWNPEPGVYHDDAQAAASLAALREMARRRIPTVVSIWEGPKWMLGGDVEQSGRTLDPSKYDACIEAIVRYLVVARNKYGAVVEYVSFNEPDYGVNFKFSPNTMADFIRRAGLAFVKHGLKTRFLVGDTAGGSSAVAFDTPLLSDATITSYLGPIAFHCWDVLTASDESYEAIAELGKRFDKPVWCLEAGHDAQLWQAKDPWSTWDNALRTAMAYERTIRLAQPSRMDYWTYQDNYPLADKVGPRPYPVFGVVRQMGEVFAKGMRVVPLAPSTGGLQAMGTVDATGKVAFILINSRGRGTVSLSGLPPNRAFILSTSDRSKAEQRSKARTDAKGRLKVSVPTRSVVTGIG